MIGNKNKDEFMLACCHCGFNMKLNQVAHRNSRGFVIGYLFVCKDCLPEVAGKYTVALQPIER